MEKINPRQAKLDAVSQQGDRTIFEKLRVELGYADYLGALQRYRAEKPRELTT